MSDALYFKRSPGISMSVTVGATPFIYVNTSPSLQIATVNAGIVTLIEMDYGAGFAPQVAIAGTFTMFPANRMRIVYVSLPTMGTVDL